jgi:hypothetical protein
MAWWTRKKRRRLLITTPHTTPGRPRARNKMKVLLRHTLEVPPHGRVGRVGIDLHLGKSLSLGGGTPTIHSSIYYILSVLCISMFRFLYYSCSYFFFPKHKKTKNISVVSLYLFL